MECKTCKKEITGNYITVLDDKYHSNCLLCVECSLILQDVYFLKNSEILCQEHYSKKYSSKCVGCGGYIYQEYLQNSLQKWHIECYKLYKNWDLKLEKLDLQYDKFKRILENLENFEIKTGQQISKILVGFSNLELRQVSGEILILLKFIETLFYSLFLIEIEAQKYYIIPEFTDSVKDMACKIVEFIEILSKKDLKRIQIDKMTELVYSVKLVIRLGLKDAQRIQELGSTDLFLQFIEWLEEEVMFSREGEDSEDLQGHTTCRSCGKELDGECFGVASKKWHVSCITCNICQDAVQNYFMIGNILYCSKHVESGTEVVVRHISGLEQYNYLLLSALKRFCVSVNTVYPPNLEEIEVLERPSSRSRLVGLNDSTFTENSSESESEEYDSNLITRLSLLSPVKKDESVDDTSSSRNIYISDLTGYRYMIANQMAAVSLHSMLGEYYSLNELMSLVNYQKVSAWSKFLDKVRPINIVKRLGDKGYFGVPLESQVEASGCTLNIGPRYIQKIRLPLLLRDLILALFEDLSVEGIFRKNGNIKKLKIFSKACNADPSNISLKEESPIQLAALMKKYFRELPDPLLTRKLYGAFISTQKIEPNSRRLQALNLVLCLLPKTNYEILQVLAWFFEHLSTNFGIRNKMDVDSIATVIAPGVLSSRSNKCSTDELVLSISVFKSIIIHQHSLWLVPLSITNVISRLGENDEDMDKNRISTSQEIIREYRNEIIRRKNSTLLESQSLDI